MEKQIKINHKYKLIDFVPMAGTAPFIYRISRTERELKSQGYGVEYTTSAKIKNMAFLAYHFAWFGAWMFNDLPNNPIDSLFNKLK